MVTSSARTIFSAGFVLFLTILLILGWRAIRGTELSHHLRSIRAIDIISFLGWAGATYILLQGWRQMSPLMIALALIGALIVIGLQTVILIWLSWFVARPGENARHDEIP